MRMPNREGEGRIEWRKPILMGLFGIPFLLTELLLLALLQYRGVLPAGGEALWTRLCLLLAATASACAAAAGSQRKKLISAALGEGALLLFVILLGVFTKNGSLFNMSLVYAILILICGGFVGGLLSAGSGKGKVKRRRV